jgi:hypothetical protein
MSMGGPGDHPLTDLLHWNTHPFPLDMEKLVLQIRDLSPRFLDRITTKEWFDWEKGENLDAGRQHLRDLISEYETALHALIDKSI